MRSALQTLSSLAGVERTFLYGPDPNAPTPFVVFEAGAWGTDPDRALPVTQSAVGAPLRVRAVATTPDGAAILLGKVRAGIAGRHNLTAGTVDVKFIRSEFIGFDDAAVNPRTGRFMAYGVDTYQVHIQPAKTNDQEGSNG